MRFKPAILSAALATAAPIIGSGTLMAERPAAALSVAKASGDGMEVTVVANGGGVTYFGGVFLEFGDGKRQLICRGGQGCRETQTAHRYDRPGSYKIRMVGLGEPEQKPLAEATVTVPLK